MTASRRTQLGITLLETLLVIAIGATFFITGMRMYLSFKQDTDVLQLRANVDMLMAGMSQYYQTVCGGSFNSAYTTYTPGILNPDNSQYYGWTPVSFSTLISGNFIPATMPPNSLVDTTAPNGGYITEFMLYDTAHRTVNVSPSGTGITGDIPNWHIIVAVKLKSSLSASVYKNVANADCASDSFTFFGSPMVFACGSNISGQYLVWDRKPSTVSVKATSPLSIMSPTLQQFQQMYTTYPMTYLLGTTPQGGTPVSGKRQNYLCGD